MKNISLIFLNLCLILFYLGCGPSPSEDRNYGSLSVTINDSLSVKTIAPDIEMSCSSYRIICDGPGGIVYRETTTHSCKIDNLVEGDWVIRVDGFNEDDIKIVTGIASVTLIKNTVNKVTITVTPLQGMGSLDLSILWQEGIVEDPSLIVTLYSSDNELINDLSDKVYRTNNELKLKTILETGYYVLNLELKDGSETVWGITEPLRIIYQQTAEAAYRLSTDDLDPKNPKIITDIIHDYQNPIKFTLLNAKPSLDLYEALTVEAYTYLIEVDSYQWFLDGKLLEGENNPTLTIGGDLPPGRYRVGCIVKKGNVLSGDGFVFSVLSGIKKVEKISLRVPVNDMVWDGTSYWGYERGRTIYQFNRQMDVIGEHIISGSEHINSNTLGEGVEWDGTNFWIIANDQRAYQLDTAFKVLKEFTLPDSISWPKDIAWDGNHLWIGYSYYLVKCAVQGDNLEIIETHTLDVTIRSMIWINGRLWLLDRYINPDIHLYSSSLTKLYRYKFEGLTNSNWGADGFCWDGRNFWTFDTFSYNFYDAYKIFGLDPN